MGPEEFERVVWHMQHTVTPKCGFETRRAQRLEAQESWT